MFRKSVFAAAVIGVFVFATSASAVVIDPIGPPPDVVGVPGPVAGAGLPGLIAAGAAFIAWKRRRARVVL